jgi:hypothetical protein
MKLETEGGEWGTAVSVRSCASSPLEGRKSDITLNFAVYALHLILLG